MLLQNSGTCIAKQQEAAVQRDSTLQACWEYRLVFVNVVSTLCSHTETVSQAVPVSMSLAGLRHI